MWNEQEHKQGGAILCHAGLVHAFPSLLCNYESFFQFDRVVSLSSLLQGLCLPDLTSPFPWLKIFPRYHVRAHACSDSEATSEFAWVKHHELLESLPLFPGPAIPHFTLTLGCLGTPSSDPQARPHLLVSAPGRFLEVAGSQAHSG